MLIGVTTCLNYSPYLKETLLHNIRFFDKFYVITSKKDKDTIKLCKKIEKVILIKTEVFFDNNAPFYKSKALNLVLDTLAKEENIWCAIIDADVLLPEAFEQIDFKNLDKDCIYSYKRNKGISVVTKYILGYFQLFNTQSVYYNFNYDLMFRTAAGSDIIFSMQWPSSNNIIFEQGVIKHISLPAENWCGVDEYEDRIQKFIEEIKPFVNNKFNESVTEKVLIDKYVDFIKKMKGSLFQQELNLLYNYKKAIKTNKERLNSLKNFKTNSFQNNKNIKEDIKKFINNQKVFIDRIETEINTYNASIQELS